MLHGSWAMVKGTCRWVVVSSCGQWMVVGDRSWVVGGHRGCVVVVVVACVLSWVRSYQCPPYSCWILVIPVESGGIQWSKIWQEGLLIFSFRCILIPVEFGHSGIETRMVPGLVLP